jgi:hypothetical protein
VWGQTKEPTWTTLAHYVGRPLDPAARLLTHWTRAQRRDVLAEGFALLAFSTPDSEEGDVEVVAM